MGVIGGGGGGEGRGGMGCRGRGYRFGYIGGAILRKPLRSNDL